MTQQHAMERILEQWIITGNNLHHLTVNMGPGWLSTESARTRKNDLERILRHNGFVYRVVTEQNDHYSVAYLFRKKRVRNYRKVHENWLTKHNVIDPQSSEFKEVDITGTN